MIRAILGDDGVVGGQGPGMARELLDRKSVV
jgi:hypothetical protein